MTFSSPESYTEKVIQKIHEFNSEVAEVRTCTYGSMYVRTYVHTYIHVWLYNLYVRTAIRMCLQLILCMCACTSCQQSITP